MTGALHARTRRGRWNVARVVIGVGVAGLLVGACATPRDARRDLVAPEATQPVASPSAPIAAPSAAVEMRDAGVGALERAALVIEPDVRHGEVDGRAWTLVTSVRGDSMCVRLGWDDVVDDWDVCYPMTYASQPLVWTNPTPPPGDHREMMFVVGLAPRSTDRLQVMRGDVVVGEADAFEGGTLIADRAGFAIPVVVEGRDAMHSTVVLPGDDLRAGVLMPLEVVALDASGDELVRALATVGNPAPLLCLDTGEAVMDGACMTPEHPAPVGSIDGRLVLVPAPEGAAIVDLVLDGVVTASHATATLTPPTEVGWPIMTLAGFELPPNTGWYGYVIETRDAAGNMLTSTPLFQGDGEGEIPGTL